MPATDFLPYAHRMLDLLRFSNAQLAADVDRGEYPGEEDNLDMEPAFLDHIVATSEARGIDASVPDTSGSWCALRSRPATAGTGSPG